MSAISSWVSKTYYSLLSIFYQQELDVVVLGFPNSGKSTLTNIITGKAFQPDTIPTMGVELNYYKVNNLLLKLVDISGQERFQSSVWKEYYNLKSDLIVYVIDLSDTLNLEDSKKKLIEIIKETNDRNVPILILGNKVDLISNAEFLELSQKVVKNSENTGNKNNNNNDNSNTQNMNRMELFMNFLGLRQESQEKFILRRLVSNPVINQVGEPDKKNNKKIIIEHNEEEIMELYRDIGVFLISCKEDDYIQDIITWIIGR